MLYSMLTSAVRLAPLALLALGQIAHAEVDQIRMSRGLSLGFLPSIIMEDQKLVQKHASEAGLGEVDVQWNSFIGGAAMNEQLLAGQVDFAGGGPPPFMVLWARTKDTPLAVKAVAALNSSPMFLLTRKENVNSIADFGPDDRIAVPGLKISNQAVVLQMASEKAFGDPSRLDPLTVQLGLPDAYAMLKSGTEITAAFSGPPFQYLSEDHKASGIRAILNSEEVLGGPTTFLMMWTTQRFAAENPKAVHAVYNAIAEAIHVIDSDKQKAAEIFLRVTNERTPQEEIVRILEDPTTRFGLAPNNIMQYADFLSKNGVIKERPESWKDLFLPGPVHELEGS